MPAGNWNGLTGHVRYRAPAAERVHFQAQNGESSMLRCAKHTLAFSGVVFGLTGPEAAEALYRALRLREPEALHGIDGEYALALWDDDAQELSLASDPMGSRSLFFVQNEDGVWFSTELRRLILASGVAPRVDVGALARCLGLGPGAMEGTLFEGVHRVHPGTLVRIRSGTLSKLTYWSPAVVRPARSADPVEYVEGLRHVLHRAVADRLRSGGTIACQLSGGLDSGSVTAVAASELARDARTLFAVTAAPMERAAGPLSHRFCDETVHACCVAEMYPNIRHRVVRQDTQLDLDLLDRVHAAEGLPMMNPDHLQWIARTYAWARSMDADTMLTASLGNVTMSYGGDFSLASLLREGRAGSAVRLARAYRMRRQWTARSIVGNALQGWSGAWLNRLHRGLSSSAAARDITGVRTSFLADHQLDPEVLLARFRHESGLQARIDFLSRADVAMGRSSAATVFGLWRTDPTADPRVVEFCLSVPEELFAQDGIPRSLIRRAMAGKLPDLVRNEMRRGLQSSDFLVRIQHNRDMLRCELRALMDVPLARACLDVECALQWIEWDDARVMQEGWSDFVGRIGRVIGVGRFLRRIQEGTIFEPRAEGV